MRAFGGFVLALVAASSMAQGTPGSKLCVAAIQASLRDPSSMQLIRVNPDSKPWMMNVEGREQLVRGYEIVVNAKNGFGGYTGNEGWMCVVDAAQTRVVRLITPAQLRGG